MIVKRGAVPAVAPASGSDSVDQTGLVAATVVAFRGAGPDLSLRAESDGGLGRPDAPPGVVFAPTEDVLLLRVQLPSMSASQRRQAVAFAVEDQIAQPLDEVRVVLGPELSDAKGTWLVAVASREALDAWSATARGAAARLIPDVLALPRPADGWAVWAGAGRALVRQADGTGFAVRLELLPGFWTVAGMPPVILYGGALPAEITATSTDLLPRGPDRSLGDLDLLAGWTAGRRPMVPRDVRALIVVGALAGLAHLAMLVVDVAALGRVAAVRGDALQDVLSPMGLEIDADLDAVVADALAARRPDPAGGFLPLMQRASVAMAAEAGRVTLQSLRYAKSDDAAVLLIEAPDIETLQTLERSFGDAGLGVVAGAATTSEGAAQAEITLRGGGL